MTPEQVAAHAELRREHHHARTGVDLVTEEEHRARATDRKEQARAHRQERELEIGTSKRGLQLLRGQPVGTPHHRRKTG